jgi:putative oxidoreductase
MDPGLFVLHAVVGLLFIGHGLQKLIGAFDGPGIDGTAAMMESLEMRPERAHAIVVGFGETIGGVLLAFGFLTPLGAALVIAVMVVASLTAHRGKGLWSQNGGFELPLVMGTVAFALAGAGPGEWSLDYALGLELDGAAWALGALALGGLAGIATVLQGRTTAPPRPVAEPPRRRRPTTVIGQH